MRPWALILLSSLLPAATIEETLAALDRGAASFKSMAANVKWVSHQGVVDEDNTDTGTIVLRRPKPGEMHMLIELAAPSRKSVLLSGGKLEVYFPKIQTVQQYDVGKSRQTLEQFLLLGFGASGKELAEGYELKWLGVEAVEGQPASHLELTPKSAEVRKHLKKAELWISDRGGHPVRQKLYFLAGDYSLISYTGVRINPAQGGAALALRLPRNVKREFPQK